MKVMRRLFLFFILLFFVSAAAGQENTPKRGVISEPDTISELEINPGQEMKKDRPKVVFFT
ncbi:hypothetical protein SDC9_160829 [bioreactor metagenome]|uniref:Uncharacterized protein n=1 Tax=bioreactor metagenome TaxID=1076179 RepID=A0A645FGJ1_9ZZZZ|nr:hypothetical protein [Proteiniphilum sp.]MEA4917578.1 hypothetical protein [Proteiniphilum sp.]